MKKARRLIFLGIFLLGLVYAAAKTPTWLQKLQKTEVAIPTARVARGPLETTVYTIGDLRPSQISTIIAPPVGGTLQIVHLVQTGTIVAKDDVIVEFDPSEQEFNLEQAQSQLEEADQQIAKLKADIAVRTAEDNLSLLRAQFAVSRAELQAKGNDLLGSIDARKNVIAVEEAKRRLEQLQRDLKSRQSSNQADLAVQNVARMKASMGMKVAQQSIDNMTLRAPMGGIVVLGQNIQALIASSGGIITSTTEIPEYREGDQAYPGQTIAQIQDVSQMDILSKVSENVRSNLESGQTADVHVDSLPTIQFTGKIKSLAGMASTSVNSVSDLFGSSNSFDTTFQFDSGGARVSPGVSARIEIRSNNIKDVLSIPRQALFTKEGKPVVYLKNGQAWDARPVQIKYLTESRVAIDGISEGIEVALVDPTLQRAKSSRKTGVLSSILGGGQ